MEEFTSVDTTYTKILFKSFPPKNVTQVNDEIIENDNHQFKLRSLGKPPSSVESNRVGMRIQRHEPHRA